MACTLPLDFAYEGDFIAVARKMQDDFNVRIRVVSLGTGHGFPRVELSGDRADVKKALVTQWDDGGSTPEELSEWADCMIDSTRRRYVDGKIVAVSAGGKR